MGHSLRDILCVRSCQRLHRRPIARDGFTKYGGQRGRRASSYWCHIPRSSNRMQRHLPDLRCSIARATSVLRGRIPVPIWPALSEPVPLWACPSWRHVPPGSAKRAARVPSSLNPIDWWHRAEGGKIAEDRPAPPGADQPYPDLNTVPGRPTPPNQDDLNKLTAALVADRGPMLSIGRSAGNPRWRIRPRQSASPGLFGVGSAPPPGAAPPAPPSNSSGGGNQGAGATPPSGEPAAPPMASASMPAVTTPPPPPTPPAPAPRKAVQSAPLEPPAPVAPPAPPPAAQVAPAPAASSTAATTSPPVAATPLAPPSTRRPPARPRRMPARRSLELPTAPRRSLQVAGSPPPPVVIPPPMPEHKARRTPPSCSRKARPPCPSRPPPR